MSEILELDNLTDIEDTITESIQDVVVLFTAPSWCVPCQRLHPHWVKTAEQTDAVFVEIDIDKAEPVVSTYYGVMSVPTIKLFSNAEYVRDLKSRTVLKLIEEISS